MSTQSTETPTKKDESSILKDIIRKQFSIIDTKIENINYSIDILKAQRDSLEQLRQSLEESKSHSFTKHNINFD
jgi:hypothetical protein